MEWSVEFVELILPSCERYFPSQLLQRLVLQAEAFPYRLVLLHANATHTPRIDCHVRRGFQAFCTPLFTDEQLQRGLQLPSCSCFLLLVVWKPRNRREVSALEPRNSSPLGSCIERTISLRNPVPTPTGYSFRLLPKARLLFVT